MEQFKVQWHCHEISCYRRWGRCSFPLQTVEKVSIWTLQQWQFSCWWPWSIVIRSLRWRVTKRLLLEDQRVAIIWRGIMIYLNLFTLVWYINILNPDFIATISRETSYIFLGCPVFQYHRVTFGNQCRARRDPSLSPHQKNVQHLAALTWKQTGEVG